MNRLLLITYGFPPVSRVQSQDAAKLAKGLAQRGWEVHVLTVADPPTYLLDESLAEQMPDGVIVHGTYSLEPTRLLQLYRRVRRQLFGGGSEGREGSGSRSYTSLPPWAVRAARSLFFPEEKVGWTPWAVRAGLRLHRAAPFAVIVSTGPPYTAHGIAERVARGTGRPWLATLMDPIVGCYAFPPATPLHAWLSRRLEGRVAGRAKAIAIATRPWADALVARNPACRDRVTIYPNSFDPADYRSPPPAPHDGFLVSYVGTFQLSICPDTFLDAVVALRADPEIARDLRVRFVAPYDAQTTRAIAERGLESVVECTGLVGHYEAVQEMRAADALLLVLGPERQSEGILSGKLPEYLAAGRMILAEVPDGVAADTVRRAGAGLVVPPRDARAAEDALREMHRLWRAGSPFRLDPQVVAELDRERNLDHLADVLVALEECGEWRVGEA